MCVSEKFWEFFAELNTTIVAVIFFYEKQTSSPLESLWLQVPVPSGANPECIQFVYARNLCCVSSDEPSKCVKRAGYGTVSEKTPVTGQ